MRLNPNECVAAMLLTERWAVIAGSSKRHLGKFARDHVPDPIRLSGIVQPLYAFSIFLHDIERLLALCPAHNWNLLTGLIVIMRPTAGPDCDTLVIPR